MLIWKSVASVKFGLFSLADRERGNDALIISANPLLRGTRTQPYRLREVVMTTQNDGEEDLKILRLTFVNTSNDMYKIHPRIVLRSSNERETVLVSTITGRLAAYMYCGQYIQSHMFFIIFGGPIKMVDPNDIYALMSIVDPVQAVSLGINANPENERVG